jgi:hypothetical protein
MVTMTGMVSAGASSVRSLPPSSLVFSFMRPPTSPPETEPIAATGTLQLNLQIRANRTIATELRWRPPVRLLTP